MRYRDIEYECTVKVLIDDIYYSNASYDTKVARIRKYAEILVRRLLKYDPEKPLTLGHKNTLNKLDKKQYTEPLLRDSLKQLNSYGSESTHSQKREPASKQEYEEAIQNLFNIYAYLFVDYFKKNRFGSNPSIVSTFSLLPPIIRSITLQELHAQDPDNLLVINKLLIAIVKAEGILSARKWLEDNRSFLIKKVTGVKDDLRKSIVLQHGEEIADIIISQIPDSNMYEDGLKIIESFSDFTPLYTDFESALSYYKTHGIVSGQTKDVEEFNSLLLFVFNGRKELLSTDY